MYIYIYTCVLLYISSSSLSLIWGTNKVFPIVVVKVPFIIFCAPEIWTI